MNQYISICVQRGLDARRGRRASRGGAEAHTIITIIMISSSTTTTSIIIIIIIIINISITTLNTGPNNIMIV